MNDEQLRKNLIFLRKRRGYSQKDLSRKLKYETSNPVKDWECGLPIPISKIPDIANEFEISMSMLQNENLEEYIEKIDTDKNYLTKLFPFCESKQSLMNKNFKKGLSIHKKLMALEDCESFYDKSLESYRLYEAAFAEGVDEAIVNMISVSCNYKYLAKNYDFNLNEKEKTKANKYLENETSANTSSELKEKNFLKTITIYNKEEKRNNIEVFIEETSSIMLQLLRKMKTIDFEMYEYYSATIFLHNLIDTIYRKEENSLFGEIYYKFLLSTNNRYVKELEEALIKE